MNTDSRVEQRIAAALNRAASTGHPDGLLDSVLTTVGHTRMRPRWLALIKEPPMRIHSRVAAGSPALRLVTAIILVMLLAILATGTVVGGAALLGPPAIVVAQDGSGTVTTIAAGIAKARDGDTVVVRPGTYLESIVITEDITLRGEGERGAVVIEFATAGPTHAFDSGPFAYGILLVGSRAHVGNLTLHGHPDGAGDVPLSAVVIDSGAPVLEGLDVILDDEPFPDYPFFMRSAFQVIGGSTAVVRESSWDGYLRVIDPTSSPTFEDNTVSAQIFSIWDGEPVIRGNTLLDGASIGFSGSRTTGTADDNDIIDGWIEVGEGAHPTISNNRIQQPHIPDPASGERGAAIRIGSGSSPLVEGNAIVDSVYGIETVGFGAAPRVTGNTITGSVSAALVLQNGAGPTVDANVISGNATGVQVIGDSTAVLTDNRFCDNGTDLVVPDGSTLSLAGNTLCDAAVSAAP